MTGPSRTLVPPEIGISIDPTWAGSAGVIRVAVAADRAGLDLLGIQDHPYNHAHPDTWTLLTVTAAHTSSIRVLSPTRSPPSSAPLSPPAQPPR